MGSTLENERGGFTQEVTRRGRGVSRRSGVGMFTRNSEEKGWRGTHERLREVHFRLHETYTMSFTPVV